MDAVDLSTPIGIIIVIVAVVLAFKLVKTVLKFAMLALMVLGLYLAFVA